MLSKTGERKKLLGLKKTGVKNPKTQRITTNLVSKKIRTLMLIEMRKFIDSHVCRIAA